MKSRVIHHGELLYPRSSIILAVGDAAENYLKELNREILNRLQAGGEVYVSNAVLEGNFVLLACVVNFRTRLKDIKALVEIVIRTGRDIDAQMRPRFFGKNS
jgi:hypothetical protein